MLALLVGAEVRVVEGLACVSFEVVETVPTLVWGAEADDEPDEVVEELDDESDEESLEDAIKTS